MFQRTEAEDACEGLLSSDTKKRRSLTLDARWCSTVLCLSLFSAIVGSLIGRRIQSSNSDRVCFKHTSKSSPLQDDIEVSWHEVVFNGSLLKENVYRQDAGPEVDSAWEELGINYDSILVPPDVAGHVGLREDQVRAKVKYGGGFIANVEGLHHLHCLNLLRQALHWNFDYYHARAEGAFLNEDFILKKHVTHCLDILRQQLMCSVDVGVMGQVWFRPSPGKPPEAFVDFNTKHRCRYFEAIRKWAYEHQIEQPSPSDLLEPPQIGDRIFDEVP
ncbi:hypothetical protein CB0940_05480 [Cercospora beticola]|uniref:Tat pathway signal sequence n=1 Tax=Cercospora beticola TaxID=122368 RepID=A0A2G5I059_CERBT|nr:hypothetical protein CB0940_05480 [Cercospora beticola]PIA98169.1 hypothetical protein CB0940_05480 [Cercospora beticola]WPA98031.1 hypothetical protein RHO25_002642 [Cercospora beticola]CAK1359242.1 unnamed protein product [Cercospora beticola]